MAVAYYVGDHDALLSFFSDPDKFYAAAPFTFLVASLIVLVFGPGKLALDALISKRFGQPPYEVGVARPAPLRDSVSIPRP
jgi:putative oxidoreductase